jgi:anti-sigma factor RsiW
MQSIPYDLLVDLVEGRLADTEAQTLRARLATDAAAQAELAALADLIALMRDDTSVDAPEHVIQRAIRLMPRTPSRPGDRLRQLVASLVRDSWRAPQLAAGMRSVQRWPRSLVWRAEDRELDVQIRPHGEQWQLLGQVLGPEAPGAAMLSGPGGQHTAPLNELGEFVFPPLSTGRYTFTLMQEDLEIVVPDLNIGAETSEEA